MGKGSTIPYNADNALKIWGQVMNARYRCGLSIPDKTDPMKGWQIQDFEKAVPQEERYSWFLSYLYLQLILTEEWKESHKQWIHFDIKDCKKTLGN